MSDIFAVLLINFVSGGLLNIMW